MRALIPQQLSILASSVPEDDADPWSADVTYRKDDAVIDNHYLFRATKTTTGERPFDNRDVLDAPWRTVSATNRYQCLDDKLHSQTIAPEGATSLSVTVPFDRPATGFGLLNMFASSVMVTLKDSAGAVLWGGENISLQQRIFGHYQYYYEPYRYIKDLARVGLPPRQGTLTIDLYRARPAIGMIIVGEAVSLGATQYGLSFGPKDYSISDTDEYGNLTYVERKRAKLGTYDVDIDPGDLDYIYQRIMDIGKRPTLWMGDDDTGYQAMIVYGRMKEADFSLVTWGLGSATYSIEGVI